MSSFRMAAVSRLLFKRQTDLNQHVKREYTDRETGELLRQMREGVVVPQVRQEACRDIKVDAGS